MFGNRRHLRALQESSEEGADAERGGTELATGDTIHIGSRTLRVVARRDEGADQPPVLVVEESS